MPRTRMNELYVLAEGHDGLFTSKQAREIGVMDSVLVHLAQRGRLVRTARGVYRIAHYPADRFAQYREAVLWAQSSQGPERIALSHETALLVLGISDVNPQKIHLTVPQGARLRREKPSWLVLHRADLAPGDWMDHEGIPITSVERTLYDILATTHRVDLARQALADARREGFLNREQAARLRQVINRYTHDLARETSAELQALAIELGFPVSDPAVIEARFRAVVQSVANADTR
jgi:predicted transcriptional regulator of viral defense system